MGPSFYTCPCLPTSAFALVVVGGCGCSTGCFCGCIKDIGSAPSLTLNDLQGVSDTVATRLRHPYDAYMPHIEHACDRIPSFFHPTEANEMLHFRPPKVHNHSKHALLLCL